MRFAHFFSRHGHRGFHTETADGHDGGRHHRRHHAFGPADDADSGGGRSHGRGRHGDRGGHGHRGGGSRGPKMFDAGALRYLVLHLISEQPRHGYEIIKAIEEGVGGGYSPSPGVIYPLLAMLEDMGHVVAEPQGNKKRYTVTEEGQAFLAENRAFVDAVLGRMASNAEGRAAGGRVGGIREAMHAFKAAVVERVRGERLSEAQQAALLQILEEAAERVRKL